MNREDIQEYKNDNLKTKILKELKYRHHIIEETKCNHLIIADTSEYHKHRFITEKEKCDLLEELINFVYNCK